MNKYQQALDYIESVLKDEDVLRIFDSPNYLEYINKHLFNIKELVDKATPKKTKTKMNEHNHIDRHCSICDRFVYSFDIYCSKCGQRIRSE